MSRLIAPSLSEAPDAARPLFEQIKKGLGKVPNAYATIGGLSPTALSIALTSDAAMNSSSLSRAELEAIRLAISAQNGCDYCVAAHSLAGKMAGHKLEALQQLRAGQLTGDPKLDALVGFALHVADSHGTVAKERVDSVLNAGYTPTHVVDAMMAISLITFTNLVNRVNDTEIDFPLPMN